MQQNIAMKLAEYVTWILLSKHCQLSEKNFLLQFQEISHFW